MLVPVPPRWVLPALLSCFEVACKRGGDPQTQAPADPQQAPAPATASPLASSQTVCDHLIAILEADAEAADAAIPACVADFDAERAMRDDGEWEAFTGCLLGAEQLETAAQCYRSHDDPEQRVCEHVLTIIVDDVEGGGQEVGMDADARAREVARCAETLLADRQALAAPAYREVVECMLAARDSGQLQACAESVAPGSSAL